MLLSYCAPNLKRRCDLKCKRRLSNLISVVVGGRLWFVLGFLFVEVCGLVVCACYVVCGGVWRVIRLCCLVG